MIDVVIERSPNLHRELLQLLELWTEFGWQSPSGLYAVAYRMGAGCHCLEVWPDRLAMGEVLPTLPLRLDIVLCLPLRLEETYAATCASLRIAV